MVLSTFVDAADYRQAAGGKICALHIFFYESRVRVPARGQNSIYRKFYD